MKINMKSRLILSVILLVLACAGMVMAAGETVNVSIGTLPAGKSITIIYDVMVNDPLPAGTTSVSQQGTVSGSNFSSVNTDDPDSGPAGDATVTLLGNELPVTGFGKALSFNGTNQSVLIADAAALTSAAFTVEAWVKFNTIQSTAIIQRLNAAGTISAFGLYLNSSGNFVHYADDGAAHTITGTTVAEAGKWYHVAGAFSAGTLRLFVNGVEEGAPVSGIGSLTGSMDHFEIGRSLTGSGDNYLDGQIDEVRIWNTALTASGLSDWLYRGLDATNLNYSGLKAYYKLDDGTGTAATDSAAAFDGALQNMTDANWVDSTINEWYMDEDVPVSGKLVGSDTDGASNNGTDWALTFELVPGGDGAKGHAVIGPDNNFTYTPNANQSGDDTFTYKVKDAVPADSNNFTVKVHIASVNDAPVLSSIGDQSVNELSTLNFTAGATDAEMPGDTVTFSLDAGAPSGASINSSTGEFSWTPIEAQGPGVYTVTIRVTDNGTPALEDFETIQITVNEVNTAPILGSIGNKTVDEHSLLTFTATATDGDLPADTLTYSLDAGAPSGASIDPSTGVFTWTPTEAQGPGVYSVTIRVTDSGTPAIEDFETIQITVNEVCILGTLTVTNTNDSGLGSLRQAIDDLCSGATIDFNIPGAGPHVITLTSGQLVIDKNMTIAGQTDPGVVIDGNYTSRVFNALAGVTVTLDSLTIRNGAAGDAFGGGILNSGVLTLLNSTLSGNSANAGGGMHNEGSAAIAHVTFSNNYAASSGGGMYNMPGTNPLIANVTFSGNYAAAYGGGMGNGSSSPVIVNTTFSGNSAFAGGGGIANFNGSSPVITNVTFSGNAASNFGGGIYNINTSNPVITNSILWGNTAPLDGPEMANYFGSAPIVTYSVIAGGYGGIGNISTDPMLAPLGDYGGQTQTIALLSGSSAVNTGDDAACAAPPVNNLDQRGIARPQGAHCDIGAYEFLTGTATAIVSSLNPSIYGDSVTLTATISDSEAASTPAGTVTFRDGLSDICTDVAVSAAGADCTTSALGAGDHTITAEYTSNGSFSGSASGPLTQTVNKASQAALTLNAGSPLTYNVTETLTTTGGSGTGAVSYSLISGSCTLVGDQLTANNGTGTCTVQATKAADANYHAVTSAEIIVTLQKANQSSLTLNAGSPLTYNTTETLTTTGGSGTGAVTYQLTAGSCSLVGDQLTADSGTGTCSITATKAGDANYNQATASATVTLQRATQTGLTLNAGSPLTYNTTETLSTTGGNGAGAVSYQVTAGSCTVLADQLTANSGTGACTVQATKAADNNYNQTAASATVTLQKASTTTGLNASVAFAIPVPTVTLTATISSASGVTPSGTVTFKAGGSDIAGCASVAVVSGTATCMTNSLTPGVYEITAEYSGDANYLGSTSEVVSVSTFLGKMSRNSWYLSPEVWILRAYTKADAPNEVYLEVIDTGNNVVNPSGIAGMTGNPMLIASDAAAPEVALGFDRATRTAHVTYTSAGGRQVVSVTGVRQSP